MAPCLGLIVSSPFCAEAKLAKSAIHSAFEIILRKQENDVHCLHLYTNKSHVLGMRLKA